MASNLNFTRRIVFGFMVVVGMMMAVSWTANSALNSSQKSLDRATYVESTKIRDVARMVQKLISIQRAEKNVILSKSQAEMDEHHKAIITDDAALRNLLKSTANLVDIEGTALLDDFDRQYSAYSNTQAKVIDLTRQNANVKARELSQGAARDAYDMASRALALIVKSNDAYAEQINNAVLVSGDIVRLSARTVQDLLSITRAERNLILSLTEDEMDEYADFIAKTRSEMQDRREQLRGLVDDEGKAMMDSFTVVWDRFLDINSQVRELSRINSNIKAFDLAAHEGRHLADRGERLLARLTNKNDREQALLLAELAQTNNKVKLAAQINHNLTEIQRGEKNVILATTQAEMNDFSANLFDIRVNLESRLEDLSQIFINEQRSNQRPTKQQKIFIQQGLDRLDEFTVAYKNYRLLHEQVREISRQNSNAQALLLSTNVGRTQFEKSRSTLVQLVNKVDEDMALSLVKSSEALNYSRSIILATTIALALLMMALVYIITRSLNTRTKQLVQRVEQLAAGHIQSANQLSVKPLTKDELSSVDDALDLIETAYGQVIQMTNSMAVGNLKSRLIPRSDDDPLVEAINKMADNSEEMVGVANTIASGELSAKIVVKSDEDQLALAMRTMLVNLREADKSTTRRKWVDKGVAQINSTVRGEKSPQELANSIIKELCAYLDASIGTLFIRRDVGTHGDVLEHPELHLLGTYAYTSHEHYSSSYAWGESLVGQAALEARVIKVSNLPKDYIKVTSALGETTPNHLIVVPFTFENRVRGVLEIGSLMPFTEQAIELLEHTVDAIGIAFESAHHRLALDQSLKDSQNLTEELQAQHEELETTNDQLREHSEALKKSQKDVEGHNQRLESAQEELNERAHQLTQSGRYKSEFLANMSHELRTPLNSILLLSKMISVGDVNGQEEQRTHAQVIHDAGTDLLNLINEVLDLSKIEAGKMDVNLTTFDINEFVQSFNALFQPQAQDLDLDFEIDVDATLPNVIHSDRERLQQVLRNFLSNAFKFTRQGGVRIEVTAVTEAVIGSVVTIGNIREKLRSAPQDYVVFSVIDTGIGIQQDKRELVFEAFQQADGTTSRAYGGTGLGLSISNQIANVLEGGLALETAMGNDFHGSTFSIILPLRASAKLNMESDEASQLQGSGPVDRVDVSSLSLGRGLNDDRLVATVADSRVLLVIEDDIQFASTLIELGRKSGFKVIHASSGTEGIRLAASLLPCAILLDIKLPILDGWSVLRHLKKHSETSHIPVHIITALPEAQLGYRLGAAQYLVKPVQPEQLDSAFDKIEYLISDTVRKLLIVEDNKIEREAIIKLLGSERDIACVGVSTGEEALVCLRTNSFDAVVLDLRLTDMNGYEVLKAMHHDETIKRIPVIVYTSKDISRAEEKALREYAESIVLKTAESPARLLEETSIFLHRVRSELSLEKQQILAGISNTDELFSGRTVLVVDDDIRNTFAITSVLEKKGLSVLNASDGQEALDTLSIAGDQVSLVLMDIMMPVMDGYEATRRIRADERFKHLPVIALTAKALKEDRELCIAAGASDYMTKPIDHDQLFSLIRVWLSSVTDD